MSIIKLYQPYIEINWNIAFFASPYIMNARGIFSFFLVIYYLSRNTDDKNQV
jgi:hypothetical protein